MQITDFPAAVIPPSALLDLASFKTHSARNAIPTVLSLPHLRLTTSGRVAIALALEHAHIGAGDDVLMPAYHCEAMVAPVRWRKVRPLFYRINPDTSIQLDDIAAKITPKTRAIIVIHYFGFEQDLRELKSLCTRHGIILIEDCAHALYGLSSGRAIGTTGDYAIASCMKFFPVYEGGLIASATRDLSGIPLSPPSFLFQLKSAINCLENSVGYKRLGLPGRAIDSLFKLKDRLWTYWKSRRPDNGGAVGPTSSEGGYCLDEAWVHKTLSQFSKWIIQNSKLDSIAEKRRQNYLTLNLALAQLPHCRPLFPALPEHTVPWVYPLYVDEPEKYFPALKNQGVPVWRFGEFLDSDVTVEVCPLSIEYSKHIFQFPCHQSLAPNEIDWMLAKIKAIFTEQQ